VVAELMLNGVASRVGEEHLPSLPGVAAAPEGGIPGIDDLGISGIEGED